MLLLHNHTLKGNYIKKQFFSEHVLWTPIFLGTFKQNLKAVFLWTLIRAGFLGFVLWCGGLGRGGGVGWGWLKLSLCARNLEFSMKVGTYLVSENIPFSTKLCKVCWCQHFLQKVWIFGKNSTFTKSNGIKAVLEIF